MYKFYKHLLLMLCVVTLGISAVSAQTLPILDTGRANQYFADGRSFEEQGELEQAYAAYREAYELDGEHYRALYRAGRLLQQFGRQANAISAMHQVVAIAPDFYPAWNLLGILFTDTGYAEGAVNAYKHGTDVAPDMASAWRNYARALAETGNLQQAVTAYQRAVDLEPTHGASLVALGVLYGRLGQRGAAAEALEAALELDAVNADAKKALAWVNGELTGTVADSAENAAGSETGAAGTSPKIFFQEGGSFTKSGLYKPPSLTLESPVKLRDRGIRLIHEGHYRLGVEALEQARRYGEQDPVLFTELGYANYQLEDYEKAAWAYGMAAEQAVEPEGWYRLNQALALREAGDLPGAEKAVKRAIDLDSGLAHAHYLLGMLRLEQNDLTKAIRSFRSAVKLDPQNISVHLALGAAQITRHEEKDAIRTYRQALRVHPGQPEALFKLAPLLEKQGESTEAYDAYEALALATANQPEYAAWHELATEKVKELAWAASAEDPEVSGSDTPRKLPYWLNN
ncbi:tetratricopeptide repeat protein [bacterium]|nr:tetratricopeptide repeat protein [bacterium]